MLTLPTRTHRDGDLVGDARRDAGPAGRLRARRDGANWSMTTRAMVKRTWARITSAAIWERTSPAHPARPLGAST